MALTYYVGAGLMVFDVDDFQYQHEFLLKAQVQILKSVGQKPCNLPRLCTLHRIWAGYVIFDGVFSEINI